MSKRTKIAYEIENQRFSYRIEYESGYKAGRSEKWESEFDVKGVMRGYAENYLLSNQNARTGEVEPAVLARVWLVCEADNAGHPVLLQSEREVWSAIGLTDHVCRYDEEVGGPVLSLAYQQIVVSSLGDEFPSMFMIDSPVKVLRESVTA